MITSNSLRELEEEKVEKDRQKIYLPCFLLSTPSRREMKGEGTVDQKEIRMENRYFQTK